MEDSIQVFMTVPTEEEGRNLAQVLVEERLAACVQVIGPMRSTYRWQGSVETSDEYLCIAKTTAVLFDSLESRVRALHPYEVPELVAVPIAAGSEKYLAWLESSVSRPES